MKKQMLIIELHAIEQKITHLETIKTVTDVPESESLKTKAIPKKTASGKETVLLRPRIHQVKEEHKDQRLKITEETPLGFEPIIEFEEFKQLWNKARAACQEDFLHERFITTDKTTKSLYNFIEGADPTLIHQAFKAGLINNIYPSNNLLELRDFPNLMINAIKNFRKKVLKAKDGLIYIKVISTIPD
ncbi:hypothetical protein Tco_0694045 [Tanacetum coccineum]